MMFYRDEGKSTVSVSARRGGVAHLLGAAIALGAVSGAQASATEAAEPSNAPRVENASLYSLGGGLPYQPRIALGAIGGGTVAERVVASDAARPGLYDFTASGAAPTADEATKPYLSGLNPMTANSAGGSSSLLPTLMGGLLGLAILLAAALTDSKQHRRKTISGTHR